VKNRLHAGPFQQDAVGASTELARRRCELLRAGHDVRPLACRMLPPCEL